MIGWRSGSDRTLQRFTFGLHTMGEMGTGSRPKIRPQGREKEPWAGCLSPFPGRNADVNLCKTAKHELRG